jgi:hypothetical protein
MAQELYAIPVDYLPRSEEEAIVVFRSCDAVGRVLLNDVRMRRYLQLLVWPRN